MAFVVTRFTDTNKNKQNSENINELKQMLISDTIMDTNELH